MSIQIPNYFAIIPANVRYCKDLEPSAKLLYGEITALTHKEGYCWATNEYFAELYGVNIKTISRWISSLTDAKFIFVDLKKKGFLTDRKIWISEEIKIKFTTGQKCPHDGTKMSSHMDKNVSHNSKRNIKKEKTTPTPSKGESVSEISQPLEKYGKYVQMKKEDHDELISVHGKALIEGLIEEMNDYISSSGRPPYKDYPAAIRLWIKRRKNNPQQNSFSKGPNPEADKELANKVRKMYSHISDIEFGDSYIEFNCGVSNRPHLKFGDKFFRENVIKYLNKFNLPTEEL